MRYELKSQKLSMAEFPQLTSWVKEALAFHKQKAVKCDECHT